MWLLNSLIFWCAKVQLILNKTYNCTYTLKDVHSKYNLMEVGDMVNDSVTPDPKILLWFIPDGLIKQPDNQNKQMK